MSTRGYLLFAALFAALLAGNGYALGQAHDETTGVKDHLKIRQLIDRQAQAWEKQDFSVAADDWLPTAELVSPGGRLAISQLPAADQRLLQALSRCSRCREERIHLERMRAKWRLNGTGM